MRLQPPVLPAVRSGVVTLGKMFADGRGHRMLLELDDVPDNSIFVDHHGIRVPRVGSIRSG